MPCILSYIFPKKHLVVKKKCCILATLSYLTELSRMLKFSKEEKQEVVTQIVTTSIIFDFPGFSVLYSPFASHFAKKRSLTKKPFGVLLISCLSTKAFRAVFTLLVAGRWWVMMNCWLSGEETICSLAIANKSNCWFSVSHAQ